MCSWPNLTRLLEFTGRSHMWFENITSNTRYQQVQPDIRLNVRDLWHQLWINHWHQRRLDWLSHVFKSMRVHPSPQACLLQLQQTSSNATFSEDNGEILVEWLRTVVFGCILSKWGQKHQSVIPNKIEPMYITKKQCTDSLHSAGWLRLTLDKSDYFLQYP